MAHYLVLSLSVFGMLSVATQKFPGPEHLPSFQATQSHPAWSWSPINFTAVSWSTDTYKWPSNTYILETWTTHPQPSSLSTTPPSPSTAPPSIPSWSTISAPTTHSVYPSTLSPIGYPPYTWGPWPTHSQSWPSPSLQPPPPPPPSSSLPSLNDALIAAGAAKFAALISSDPVVSAAYAADVLTVFAPTDDYLDSTFNASRLRKRANLTPEQQQQLLLHASQAQSKINGLRTPPGSVVTTKDTSANLNGANQNVVSHPQNKTKTTSSKNWAPAIIPRDNTTTNVTTLVNIFSGLGDSVSIITPDVPYDGGFIHTTDGLFTVPLPLSSTAESTGETAFISLTNASGQTVALDSTPSITVFIPTNDAFSVANISTASSDIASILSGHVLQDFVGYLPTLTNGSNYTTQAGTTVTVTIKGDDYFVNNAKIVSSNLILENGVAHVIDSVLKLPIAPYEGAGASTLPPNLVNSIALSLLAAISLVWLL